MAVLQLTPKQLTAKRWRDANKKRIAAYRRAYRQTEAGKAARAKQRSARKASRSLSRLLKKSARDAAPFVGCDGEGYGRGAAHRYALFRMGERELYNNGARLTTPELLSFIVAHPRKTDILIGFAFEYDITSILKDCSPEQRRQLIAAYEQPASDAQSNFKSRNFWTWLDFPGWPRFGVNWLAKNHLMVCKAHPDPERRYMSDRDSIRVIYDTFGFFQRSFVQALADWSIADAGQLAEIAAMKAQRAAFDRITPEIRAYNAAECDQLAALMEKFRATCFACDLEPRTWNGAGKIASFLHRTHDTIRAKALAALVQPGVIAMAHAGYYGGRFEITRTGQLGRTSEHDINSAYPAAMLALPCLQHGTWSYENGATLAAALDRHADALFIAPARFAHPAEQFLCGLPFRSKEGRLSWPKNGNGIYWSPEIRSALRLGATITLRAGWLYHRHCRCQPFAWVEQLYRERMKLEKDHAGQGKPIKLGIASLYGKLAQRIGDPPFQNPIWAGLITAHCRAQINDAIAATDPRRVVMIATDGIYTEGKPIKLRRGAGLGQWSVAEFSSMFIVQPGLYWAEGKIKSRGIGASVIARYTAELEAVWDHYARAHQPLDAERIAARLDAIGGMAGDDRQRLLPFAFREAYPAVAIAFDAFIGLRLAAHWGKPELAGQWQQQQRKISFDWSGKRHPIPGWSSDRRSVITAAQWGSPLAYSHFYDGAGRLGSSENWEVERMLFEAMPDAEPEPEADE